MKPKEQRDKCRSVSNTLGEMINLAVPDKTGWMLLTVQQDSDGNMFTISVANGSREQQMSLMAVQLDKLEAEKIDEEEAEE
jgi:hypothetical protein